MIRPVSLAPSLFIAALCCGAAKATATPLARLSGVGLGDRITITDQPFEVVGLSRETYSAANSITFVEMSDLEDIVSSVGTYSYLLVDAEENLVGIVAETLPQEHIGDAPQRVRVRSGLEQLPAQGRDVGATG